MSKLVPKQTIHLVGLFIHTNRFKCEHYTRLQLSLLSLKVVNLFFDSNWNENVIFSAAIEDALRMYINLSAIIISL